MKYLFNSILVLALIAAMFSCEKSDNTYSGGEYIGFADSTALCPVYEDGREFEIAVAATNVVSYDRVYAVEIIDSVSTAIEGMHYSLPSNTVTIKAGQSSSSVKIKGIYENLESTDSIGVRLQIASRNAAEWELYEASQRVDVSFAKVCPFDINAFDGYIILTSTYIYEFMYGISQKMVKAKVDPDSENTIIIEDWLADGDTFRDNYDLRLSFNTDDPLLPALEMEDGQIIANTRQLFDIAYGDGWVRTNINAYNFSFYNMCQGFAYLVHDLYVEGVGTMGTYSCIFEWISDAEADYILNNGLN
ncbi:MAG: DUF4984 domain-containing protein [Rikenellaceae bacterium]